jgi:hypothetical protein
VTVSVTLRLENADVESRARAGHHPSHRKVDRQGRSPVIEALRTALSTCPAGSVEGDAHVAVEHALADAWDGLVGSNVHGMTARKLLGRTERLVWRTPILSFVIERHGALVGGGSTRGELQEWEVNTRTANAVCSRVGRRQLTPMAARLNVSTLVDGVAAALVDRRIAHPAVVWLSDDRVRVVPTHIDELQSGFKQTIAGRRKRFISALDARLVEQGWTREPSHGRFVYARQQP